MSHDSLKEIRAKTGHQDSKVIKVRAAKKESEENRDLQVGEISLFSGRSKKRRMGVQLGPKLKENWGPHKNKEYT